MIGQHQPHDKCADLTLQADDFEPIPPDHKRQRHSGKDQNLVVSSEIKQFIEHWTQQGHSEDQQRPWPRHLSGEYGKDNQRDDILHNQDADGRASVEIAHLALGLQHFGRKHGGRKRQPDPDEHRNLPVRREQQPGDWREQGYGKNEMQKRHTNHMRLTDLAQLELQAHGEQQDQNAKIGDIIEDRPGFRWHAKAWADRIYEKTGGEKSDQWRQAKWPNSQAKNKRRANGKNLKDHMNTPIILFVS